MRILPMGVNAVLIEDPSADPAGWSVGLRSLQLPGVIDIVPAARTVLVRCDSQAALAGAIDTVPRVVDMAPSTAFVGGETIEISVTYDGDDLEQVARAIDKSPAAVAALHASADYTVAFCGFAPGFAYLRGLPEPLHLPRKATPRTSVPAGSVAVAAEYSAVYPRSSPGGWHLLGTTTLAMFDPSREPPVLLEPGRRVRFVAA